MERDASEPSGLVAAPSQSPVNVSREAKVAAVGVGGKGVGVTGVTAEAAQADSTTSRRRIEKMRMAVNIIQRIKKIPLQLEGSIKDPSCEGSNQI